MQEAPIQPVFATGSLSYLGVDMPSVPVGDAVFPVLTSRPVVRGPFTGSDVAAETDGSYDADLLAPERVQASFSYLRTDAARFSMLGERREALNSGLTEKIDAEGIAGANGLLTGANLANHAAGGTTTFAQYVSRFAFSRVDGRFAATTRDLKALVGSPIFAHMGSVYRANETDTSAVDRLMSVIGMDNIRVSAHVQVVVEQEATRRHPARDAAGHGVSDVGGRLAHLRRDYRPDEGRDQHHGRPALHDQDSPRGRILEARIAGAVTAVALEVLAGPGCDDVGKISAPTPRRRGD